MVTQAQGINPDSNVLVPLHANSANESVVTSQEKIEGLGPNSIFSVEEEPSEFEEKIFRAIKSENHFTPSQRENMVQMASVAALMYKGLEGLQAVSDLFPRGLIPMKSPEDLGIAEPTGLKVQAFRHGDQVIIGIRGTELNKEKSIMLSNLIADAGIGRHKSNEDLLESIMRVSEKALHNYGYEVDGKLLSLAQDVIKNRIKGHTETSRLNDIAKRLVKATGKGGVKGVAIGVLGGSILAGAAVYFSIAAPVAAVGYGLYGTLVGGLAGSAVETAREGGSILTAGDGYPTLLKYIQAIDDYVVALKEAGYIKEKDEIFTAGHSLGGYLAGVIGAMHADEIFAFNGPGVNFEEEMPEIINNMGKKRSVRDDVVYHSVSMETDFIGNLTRRTGGMKNLYLPLTSQEQCRSLPPSAYDSPLSHHGIELILQVLKASSAWDIPFNRIRLPQAEQPMLLLTNKPHEEMVKEKEKAE